MTDLEDKAAAEEVYRFNNSWSIPGQTTVREHFRDVKLQEGLEPLLCHVKITSHNRRALACLELSHNELRVCTDRILLMPSWLGGGRAAHYNHMPSLGCPLCRLPELQRKHTTLVSVFANCELQSQGWFCLPGHTGTQPLTRDHGPATKAFRPCTTEQLQTQPQCVDSTSSPQRVRAGKLHMGKLWVWVAQLQ